MLITEYFQEIDTFPHHKHLDSGKIIGVPTPTLVKVLGDIGEQIEQLA